MKIHHNFFRISLAFVFLIITANISRAQSGNMSDITQPDPLGSIPTEPTEITDPNNPSPDNQPPTTDPETDGTPSTNPEDPQTPEAQTPEDSQPDGTANDPNTQETDQNGTVSSEGDPTTGDPNTQESDQNDTASSEGDPTASDADAQETDQNDPNQQEESETADSTDAEETGETDPESEKEEVAEKEDETETKEETVAQQEINRSAFEAQIQGASTEVAIQLHEELQITQLISSSGVQLYGDIPSVEQISDRLGQLWQQTGHKPAFINVSLQSNQLETFAVLPTPADSADSNNSIINSSKDNSKEKQNNNLSPTEPIRQTVQLSSRKEILTIAKKFRKEVSNARHIGRNRKYLESAQKLYQLIVKPLEAELEANDVDILVFSMDSGLRLIPIAALHDGEQFLIEKYAVALVPSFGLTDTRYVDVRQSPILAMGASLFEDEAPLPTMPLELRYITSNPRQGEVFLNEQFTVNNFITQNRRSDPFRIIHLGTHAQFVAGDFADSFIQFSDRQLKLPELRRISDELGWSTEDATPIELLVLSACETALGDEESELGFAGLAVQAGVKSALASLWYISDLGTLALMSEFYDNLSETLIKAEALQATQLSMLRGEVRIKDRELILSNGDAVPLPSTFPKGSLTLSDPYFWSAFTLIGNWN
ncbi:MAG: CHAT domain-containing protein [Xenococcaceae cyanobacterium MO_188.B29]|nr:CHAT domain-containing protein [Xenococcaceae cyanobacterium MO_188.B29]